MGFALHKAKRPIQAVVAAALLAAAHPVLAQTMPWSGPLQTIKNSLTNGVVQTITVVVIAVTGLLIAFGEIRGLFGRALQVIFGLSVATGAAQFTAAMGWW